MNVIFLDHQGVMLLSSIPKYIDLNKICFNIDSIKALNTILHKTDYEIVISSDWKRHFSLQELQEFYKKQGIIKIPIDVTPNIKEKNYIKQREEEILSWLYINKINNWLIIDDMKLNIEKFYHITNGLKQNIDNILKLIV